jgi:hypothetical protein
MSAPVYGFLNRHTGVAGLLLGKTRLNWLYGLKQNLIASCAIVLATPIRPVFAE